MIAASTTMPIASQTTPKISAMPSRLTSSHRSTTAPITGKTTQVSTRFPDRSRSQVAITLTLTNVNAVNAPKLMNDVDVLTSRASATSPTIPVRTMPNTGVANFGWSLPNTRGSTPSRPIAYISRDALACAAIPDANCATTRPARKNDAKRLPPIVVAISNAADDSSVNALPGWASWVK